MTSPKKRAKSRATAKVARNFLPELRQQLNRPQRQPKNLDETMPRQAKGGDQAQTERGIRRTAPRGQPPRTVPPQLSYLDAGFKPRGPSRQATASPTNRKHGSAQGQAGGRRQQRYAPYSRPPSANSSVPDRDAGLRQTSRSRNAQRTASPRAQMGVNNTHSESQPNPAGASAVGAAATEHLLTLAAAASRRIQQEGFHLQNTSRPSSRHSSNPLRLEPMEYIRDPRGDEYRGLAGGFNQHALTHEPSFYPNPHHEPEAHRRDRMRAEALNVSRAMEYLNNIADYNARVLAHYDGTNEVTFTHWTQMLWVLTEQFRRERYAPVPRTPPQFTGEEHIRRLEQPYLHPMAPPPPPPPHLRYDAPRDSFGCYWGPGPAAFGLPLEPFWDGFTMWDIGSMYGAVHAGVPGHRNVGAPGNVPFPFHGHARGYSRHESEGFRENGGGGGGFPQNNPGDFSARHSADPYAWRNRESSAHSNHMQHNHGISAERNDGYHAQSNRGVSTHHGDNPYGADGEDRHVDASSGDDKSDANKRPVNGADADDMEGVEQLANELSEVEPGENP